MGIPLDTQSNIPVRDEPRTGVVCAKGEGVYYIFSRYFPTEIQLTATQLPASFRGLRLGQWVQFVAEQSGDKMFVVGFKLIPPLFPTLPITDLVVAIGCQLSIPSTRPAPNQPFKCEVSNEVYDQKQLIQDRHLGQSCRGTIGYYQQSGRGVWLVEYVE